MVHMSVSKMRYHTFYTYFVATDRHAIYTIQHIPCDIDVQFNTCTYRIARWHFMYCASILSKREADVYEPPECGDYPMSLTCQDVHDIRGG